MSTPIAVLIQAQHVVCLSCYDDDTYQTSKYGYTALYPVNLEGYSQSCHDCTRVLTTGTFGVQLFDADQCHECRAFQTNNQPRPAAVALRAASEEGLDGGD